MGIILKLLEDFKTMRTIKTKWNSISSFVHHKHKQSQPLLAWNSSTSSSGYLRSFNHFKTSSPAFFNVAPVRVSLKLFI